MRRALAAAITNDLKRVDTQAGADRWPRTSFRVIVIRSCCSRLACEWLPENHLAWFVLDAVGEIDLSAFYGVYREDGWGRAAFEPAMMVSLLLYAYAVGERSSRGTERRCGEVRRQGIDVLVPTHDRRRTKPRKLSPRQGEKRVGSRRRY